MVLLRSMGVGPEVVGWVGVAEKRLGVTEGRLGAGGAGNLAVVVLQRCSSLLVYRHKRRKFRSRDQLAPC